MPKPHSNSSNSEAVNREAPSILIDATPLQSEHRTRGVGSYVRHLIGAIERTGVARPWYLASSFGRQHAAKLLPAGRTIHVPRPHAPAQVYWLYNEVALRATIMRLRPEVFLATDFNGLVRNPFGTTAAVLYDLTALKLLHSGEPTRPRDLSTRLSDVRWRVYECKLRRADQLVAISHSAKRDAIRLLGIPEQRISVVHLAVDHETFRPSEGQGRFADSPPYILHLGARNENKNQARLLEAFAAIAPQHPALELWFAGPWHAPDLAWLARENERLGLDGRAKHIGYVPDAELSSLYGNARVFAFPSLEEGFGLPVLEAMASGAPVVTSDRSSLPEVAGDAALLANPYETSSLARALEQVLMDPNVAIRLRYLGARRANEYSWQRTARETIKRLERLQ